MMFIDSWVWIEFFSTDARWEQAREVLEKLEQEDGQVSSLVLAEVRYRMLRKAGKEKADRVIQAIEGFDTLQVLPVTAKVAKYGADLRNRYYQRSTLEMSYADAIHLSTAILTGCDTFYSGDPDFQSVDEIETVIIS